MAGVAVMSVGPGAAGATGRRRGALHSNQVLGQHAARIGVAEYVTLSTARNVTASSSSMCTPGGRGGGGGMRRSGSGCGGRGAGAGAAAAADAAAGAAGLGFGAAAAAAAFCARSALSCSFVCSKMARYMSVEQCNCCSYTACIAIAS